MISIIVPVYNSEKTIRKCLSSIMAQTYKNWECLVVNDGSTDSSGPICDEYALKDNRFRTFHKENGGVSSARNVGLENAKGEWITFCDSDDWVYPNWLDNFAMNLTYDCQLFIQGIKTTRPLGNKTSLKYGFNYLGNTSGVIKCLYDYNLLGYLFIKLFMRSIINEYKIRFDEGLTFIEDGVFVMEYLSHTKYAFSTNRIGYHYNTPEWDKKYPQNNAISYLRLCREALEIRNSEIFHFYINCSTEGLIDSFRKKLDNRFDILQEYSGIINDYNKNPFDIHYKEKKFIILRNLLVIDPKSKVIPIILDVCISISNLIHTIQRN